MRPKVIKTAAGHRAAMARIEALMGARPGTPAGDELELLVTLVDLYEREQHPIPPPGPVSAITFRMEQAGLKPADLVPYLGSKSKVSEVLSGKRGLSVAMIRALWAGLGIPAEILLGTQPPRKSRGPARPRYRAAAHRTMAADPGSKYER